MSKWNFDQSSLQFQGEGSSHELAAVLLTECIKYSQNVLKKPLYVLYLDASSAFDVVQKELLINNLYSLHHNDNLILHIANRLSNRQTILDWDGVLMGPIADEQGLEQGGLNSSEFYKIFAKEQLTTAQMSELGVRMKNLTVSAIGQADDTLLLSNDIYALYFLLQLTLCFCSKHNVELSVEKLKLQAYAVSSEDLELLHNLIKVYGRTIPFSNEAEHVGIIRSTLGNSPSILARISAHRNALSAVLHTGIAKGHRANPVSSVKINQLYGIPVLLSGLSTLVLTRNEVDIVDRHHCETLRRLLRLLKNTPRCVTYFLAGSLPGSALIHMRQISLFGMICRLRNNILNKHAFNFFSENLRFKASWFQQIGNLCLQYNLPEPLSLLHNPLNKSAMKILVKKKVTDFWESKLRCEALSLKSLCFFKPNYMSLQKTHPLWLTTANSPRQVSMAAIQAVMLSGRYRCGSLMRHWSHKNDGVCQLALQCREQNVLEDIPHLLCHCPAFSQIRLNLQSFTRSYSTNLHKEIGDLLCARCNPSHPSFSQFLLDCSGDSEVILLAQRHSSEILNHIFLVTRTWIFNIHRERLRLLGRW